MNVHSRRDLTIISAEGTNTIVLSCDSCGGIGVKSGDILNVSPFYVGKLTARVGLMEVMCIGAVPAAIADGVCCEMKPTGAEIMRGIRAEMELAGLKDVVLTGSTEENFATVMTAVGITVVGIAKGPLKIGVAEAGDRVLVLGEPKVGAEIELSDDGFYGAINTLLQDGGVREIAPVGSKGIRYEAELLARLHNKEILIYPTGLNLDISAGPASCIAAVCSAEAAARIESEISGCKIIGELAMPQS